MTTQDNDPNGVAPTQPPAASNVPPTGFGGPPSGYPAQQPYPGQPWQAPAVVNKLGKTRNPWGVWLLSLVTFGIYHLWWYYTVNRELRDFDHQIDVQPGLSLCALLFGGFTFGIVTLVSIARTGGRIATGQRLVGSRNRCSAVVGVLLFLIGFGIVYYQSQINKVWDAYGNPPEGTLRPA